MFHHAYVDSFDLKKTAFLAANFRLVFDQDIFGVNIIPCIFIHNNDTENFGDILNYNVGNSEGRFWRLLDA